VGEHAEKNAVRMLLEEAASIAVANRLPVNKLRVPRSLTLSVMPC